MNSIIELTNINKSKDEITGNYIVHTNDIPDTHKRGEWSYDRSTHTIYLDQFHKYQTEIYQTISNKLMEC